METIDAKSNLRTGLILGAFHPPQSAEIDRMREFTSGLDDVSILILTDPVDVIPGDQRAQWIEELLPETTVRTVPVRNLNRAIVSKVADFSPGCCLSLC